MWPRMRWPEPREIEIDSVTPDGIPSFYGTFDEIPESAWRSADAIVSTFDIPVNSRDLLERLQIFVTPKVGFDNIDVDYWTDRGIPVCNVPDYGTQEVADHAMALMLSLIRCIPMHNRRLRSDPVGNWTPALNPLARRLSVSTCGVVGLGRIGTAFTLRAKAFGLDVVCYDPYLANGGELALGIRRADSLAELFAQSDIVSIHVPLSDATRNLIDAEVLSHAKADLTLINTARGEIVDIDAVYEAMRSGRLRAVGLDVLPQEPPNLDRPLLKAWADDEEWLGDRLLVTPHSAFSTPESVFDMRSKGGWVAMRYLRDNRLENCVNPGAVEGRRS